MESALAAGAAIEQLLVVEDPQHPRLGALVAAARARDIPVVPVAAHVLAAISEVETPQGVVAVIRRPPPAADPIPVHPDLLLLVVDRVQDPGNLGTMLRTADAAGATAVVLLPGTVDPYNPKSLRASMGALFHLPVLEWPVHRLRPFLRERGMRLLAADVAGAVDYRAADYRRPLALAVGNEGEGVEPELLAAADAVVRIPISGRAESLNVAVAAALLLYEAGRPVYTDADLRRA